MKQINTEIICNNEFQILLQNTLKRALQIANTWNYLTTIHKQHIQSFDEFIARCVSNDVERFVFDLIREAIDRTTQIGANPVIVVYTIIKIIENNLNKFQQDFSFIEKNMLNIRRPNQHDISTLINECSKQPLSNAISEAVFSGGAAGRILVISQGNNLTVEITNGHHITGAYAALPNQHLWSGFDIRAIVIDGVCDSVSELDHIFLNAIKLAEPIVIFARKFGADVLNTISVNNAQKKFTIIPIIIPFDNPQCCQLEDIATICGTTNITSNSWGSILTVDVTTAPHITALKCITDAIIIENNLTNEICVQASLNSNISHVRARCLSASLIKLNVVNDADKIIAMKTISAIQSAIQFGVIDVNETENESYILAAAKNYQLSIIPVSWLIDLERICYSTAKLIATSSTMIIV